MALENPLAGPTEVGAMHLEASLYGTVVAQVLATEPRRITRARALFLRCAGMLRQRGSASGE